MAKYNEEKVLSEIDKLTVDEMPLALKRYAEFMKKKMEAEQKEVAERAESLQQKINKLNQ